jgi:hypothetical protein
LRGARKHSRGTPEGPENAPGGSRNAPERPRNGVTGAAPPYNDDAKVTPTAVFSVPVRRSPVSLRAGGTRSVPLADTPPACYAEAAVSGAGKGESCS